MRLKHTPALSFEYDESVDRGMRISQLLEEVGPVDDEMMTSGRPELVADRRRGVLDVLRAATKTVVVTHEHPDGDALGSLIAMQRVLTALGHDSLMFIAESDLPLPYEYRFLPLDRRDLRAAGRPRRAHVIFLDCGNIERNPAAERLRPADGGAASSTSTITTTTPASAP